MEAEAIPRTADLAAIYGPDGPPRSALHPLRAWRTLGDVLDAESGRCAGVAAATARYRAVCEKFRERFGALPDLVARSPGAR